MGAATPKASRGPVEVQVRVEIDGVQLGGHLGQGHHEDGEGDVDRQQAGQHRPQHPPLVALGAGQPAVDPVAEQDGPGDDDAALGTGTGAAEHGLGLDHLAGVEALVPCRSGRAP